MITVLTYGTFDLFHYGHVSLLQRARALGDRLVVAVSTDEFNSGKGKKSVFPFEHRKGIVGSIRWVDQVIDETCWEQKQADIRQLNVDILVMGDDWEGKFDFLHPLCKVLYLPRTEGISSTEVRHWIKEFPDKRVQDLRQALEILSTIAQTLGG